MGKRNCDMVIDSVKSCFENESAVPDGIHKAMMELLYRYVIVGGLPEVVNCFLETKNIELIYKVQRNLIVEYEEDMVKYADDADKLIFVSVLSPSRNNWLRRIRNFSTP